MDYFKVSDSIDMTVIGNSYCIMYRIIAKKLRYQKHLWPVCLQSQWQNKHSVNIYSTQKQMVFNASK